MKFDKQNNIYQTASLIRDAILSANDGIITTFAVVAGAQGANLGHNTVILLGLANLTADAISMASGNFLGVESENQMLKNKSGFHLKLSPAKSSILTFASFLAAGSIPLIPYLFFENNANTFNSSVAMVFVSLLLLGLLRAIITYTHKLRTVFETLFVGGLAAIAAYSIGYWGDRLLTG